MKRLLALSLITLAGLGQAVAGTAVSNFSVRLTVVAECKIISAGDMNFGAQGVWTSAIDVTSVLTMQCTRDTPFTIGFNQGVGGTGVSNRVMRSPASTDTVKYQLYRDAGRTLVWGNTIGSDTANGVGTGNQQNVSVYGRLPVQPGVAPGNYSDTITVTVTY